MLEWVGDDFDPEFIDIRMVDKRLAFEPRYSLNSYEILFTCFSSYYDILKNIFNFITIHYHIFVRTIIDKS